MPTSAQLAFVNACLNATAGVLLVLGYLTIRRGQRNTHRKLMLAAFAVSVAFLGSYLTRRGLYGETLYTGTGPLRTVYFAILISHVGLAIVTVPLVLRTLFLAHAQRFDAHRRMARITFPIWLYVSVTGVIVYNMLY